jgi:uncharacterized tannase-like protein DUF6351
VNRAILKASVAIAGAFLAMSLAMSLAPPSALAQTLSIEVLSSRPELVTGGDALVRITGAASAPTVSVSGTDVSAVFKSDPKGGWSDW